MFLRKVLPLKSNSQITKQFYLNQKLIYYIRQDQIKPDQLNQQKKPSDSRPNINLQGNQKSSRQNLRNIQNEQQQQQQQYKSVFENKWFRGIFLTILFGCTAEQLRQWMQQVGVNQELQQELQNTDKQIKRQETFKEQKDDQYDQKYLITLYKQKAKKQIKYQKFQDALQTLEKALSYIKNDPELLYLKSLCLIELNQVDQCMDFINQAINENDKEQGDYNLVKGRAYFQKNQIKEGQLEFQKVLEKDPLNPDLYFQLGKSYFQLKDDENSLKNIDFALILDPQNTKAYELKSHIIKRIHTKLQEQSLKEGIVVESPEYQRVLAYIPLEQACKNLSENQLDLALQLSEKIFDYDISIMESYFLRAQIFFQQGNYGKALEELEQAKQSNDDEEKIYFLESQILQCIGKPKKSGKILDKLIKQNTDYINLYIESKNNII